MEWTELTITVPREYADEATVIATAVADNGLYIEDYEDLEAQVKAIAHVDLIEQELIDRPRDVVTIHFYLSPEDNAAAVSEQLQSKLLAAGVSYTFSTAGVRQEDWENSWKQYYHPIEIGSRLAVVPSWEEYDSKRVKLNLDPGMAFGTGTHETTYLCLEALDERIQSGERVLDVGTGSGILAIAALLLGAQSALGIDIDPMAVRTAEENAGRNGVSERFTAAAGDLAQKATGKYDVITANIVADAIKMLAPDVQPLLASDGWFIASGIIDTREAEVVQALEEAGLKIVDIRRKNGWSAILATV